MRVNDVIKNIYAHFTNEYSDVDKIFLMGYYTVRNGWIELENELYLDGDVLANLIFVNAKEVEIKIVASDDMILTHQTVTVKELLNLRSK